MARAAGIHAADDEHAIVNLRKESPLHYYYYYYYSV